jgi:hypothetical protein
MNKKLLHPSVDRDVVRRRAGPATVLAVGALPDSQPRRE